MKMKMLSLAGALALSFVALTPSANAAAALNCDKAKEQCFAGCPCALFECYPAQNYYICSCPIWCPPES